MTTRLVLNLCYTANYGRREEEDRSRIGWEPRSLQFAQNDSYPLRLSPLSPLIGNIGAPLRVTNSDLEDHSAYEGSVADGTVDSGRLELGNEEACTMLGLHKDVFGRFESASLPAELDEIMNRQYGNQDRA